MNCRLLVFLLIAGVGVGCADDDGADGTGGTGGGAPAEVTIETFNLALAGAFIPYEQERRQPLADAIANAEADILCLQEVWEQADKDAIAAAAMANFPNVVSFLDDLDTPLDDATDQNGETPPEPMTVPCPDLPAGTGMGTVQEQMNAAIDCVAQNCNTIAPGDEAGQTTSTDCAQLECTDTVAPLIVGDPQQLRCYACLAPQLPTSTFDEIRASCPTVINQELAFGGQNGLMILSRYPLSNPTNWVIPGTWNRRVITSATAELPNGSELDVYCNHLTPIFTGVAFPYTGQYGGGEVREAAWEAEQRLQALKLIDHVEATSGETPAVILGDFNAGRAFPDQDIVAYGVATLDLLETAFTPAYTADYVPQCTFCPQSINPINGPDTASTWIDHILLHNLSANSVTATSRTFDENVVPVDGMMVPLSDHYGVQSTIQVP